MKFNVYQFTIPTWAICALEYGDFSGLTDEEEEQINHFLDKNKLDYVSFEYGEDEYFTWYNDICGMLGCNCIDVKAYIPIE